MSEADVFLHLNRDGCQTERSCDLKKILTNCKCQQQCWPCFAEFLMIIFSIQKQLYLLSNPNYL